MRRCGNSVLVLVMFCTPLWLSPMGCKTQTSSTQPDHQSTASAHVATLQHIVDEGTNSVPLDAGSAVARAPGCKALSSSGEQGSPCGDLGCLSFETPEAAFAHVLATNPQVLGIGESHAQKGSEGVPSATRRFAEQLLPSLCGRTRALVLELWLPRNDCGDQRVQEVDKAQKAVTRTQVKSNQDEYVTLGYVAKRYGIQPSALIPTCDEYQAILDAGPANIERMLELVTTKTAERVVEELGHMGSSNSLPMVIAYGGALHNDAAPSADRVRFSYGPRLSVATHGHYTELDLIVREYIKDNEAWRNLPYYSALRRDVLPEKTLVYQWGEHSYALVFPRYRYEVHDAALP